MPAGVDRGAGLQLHNQIYFELMAFELCSSKAIFFRKMGLLRLGYIFMKGEAAILYPITGSSLPAGSPLPGSYG